MKLVTEERALLKSPFVLRRSLGRFRTVDTAFTFRMNAGFAGDVNRGHPASIQPCDIDNNSPPTSYGQAVVMDPATQGVRPVGAADGALTTIWGVTVRPYPIQQSTSNQNYGAVPYGGGIAPPLLQPVDVLRGGYIMVPVVGATLKGGAVFIWFAASGGGHTQGGFEAVATGGSTIALAPSNFAWNSPPDSTGIAELICNQF